MDGGEPQRDVCVCVRACAGTDGSWTGLGHELVWSGVLGAIAPAPPPSLPWLS